MWSRKSCSSVHIHWWWSSQNSSCKHQEHRKFLMIVVTVITAVVVFRVCVPEIMAPKAKVGTLRPQRSKALSSEPTSSQWMDSNLSCFTSVTNDEVQRPLGARGLLSILQRRACKTKSTLTLKSWFVFSQKHTTTSIPRWNQRQILPQISSGSAQGIKWVPLK